MASYFVACATQADGRHAVHDPSRCPGACLCAGSPAEYLGEFLDVGQALAVARLRYPRAARCPLAGDPGVPYSAAALNSDRVWRSSRGWTGFSSTGSPDSASWRRTPSLVSAVTITTPISG